MVTIRSKTLLRPARGAASKLKYVGATRIVGLMMKWPKANGLAAGSCPLRSRAVAYSGSRQAPRRQKQRQGQEMKPINLTAFDRLDVGNRLATLVKLLTPEEK